MKRLSASGPADGLLGSPGQPLQQQAASTLASGGALAGTALLAERSVAPLSPGVAGLALGTLSAGPGPASGAAAFPWMVGTPTPHFVAGERL